MSTKLKSGVSGVSILRFFGGAKRGAILRISRRNTQSEFSSPEVWDRLNNDNIDIALSEARQIGMTLVALSSEETEHQVEQDFE
jgi:hypothetical protein|tara:strand:- start:1323 stop:1574 length:252 start_codon:yes stop_codon:yes gene_type:complete